MLASQQVLERMAQILVDAATDSGGRVHTDRFHPVNTYPSTRLQVVDEDLAADEDEDVTWPRERQHTVQVDVQVHCQATSGLDALMATQAAQVLQALEGTLANATLNPLTGCSLQARSLSYQATSDGQAANGTAKVRFEVIFSTLSNDPTTFI